MTPFLFGKDDPVSTKLLQAWHTALSADPDDSQGRGDRAGRARLRRARNVDDVATDPAYCRLLLDLERVREDKKQLSFHKRRALAVVAALAARVKIDKPGSSLARQMGQSTDGGKKAVSELRFRNLLAKESPEELLAPLTRALRQLGETADLVQLARDVAGWNHEVRRRWAYDYYSES